MTVFISYSHKNGQALNELRRFLGPLEKQGKVTLWDDRKIVPGMDWKAEIDQALDGATAAVSLVCRAIFSNGSCSSSAAICASTVCAPCPTSAAAIKSSPRSIAESPCRTRRAPAPSGKPKLKAVFFIPAAIPTP